MSGEQQQQQTPPTQGNHEPLPVMLQFKVFDSARDKSRNIEASSLDDLIMQASEAFEVPVARVCLEQDGTEVDEEEYFNTLDAGTPLMVLSEDDRWMPFAARVQLLLDEMNRKSPGRCSSSSPDLELLGNMDPDCLTDIVPDKIFLEAVRDACKACRTQATPPSGQEQQQPPRETVNSM